VRRSVAALVVKSVNRKNSKRYKKTYGRIQMLTRKIFTDSKKDALYLSAFASFETSFIRSAKKQHQSQTQLFLNTIARESIVVFVSLIYRVRFNLFRFSSICWGSQLRRQGCTGPQTSDSNICSLKRKLNAVQPGPTVCSYFIGLLC